MMLSRKEREAFASFRLWARAFAQNDEHGMRQMERIWNDEDAVLQGVRRPAAGKLTMDQMRGD